MLVKKWPTYHVKQCFFNAGIYCINICNLSDSGSCYGNIVIEILQMVNIVSTNFDWMLLEFHIYNAYIKSLPNLWMARNSIWDCQSWHMQARGFLPHSHMFYNFGRRAFVHCVISKPSISNGITLIFHSLPLEKAETKKCDVWKERPKNCKW